MNIYIYCKMVSFLNKIPRNISFIVSRSFSSLVEHEVKITKIGNVTCIGLNRPENKNCLSIVLLKKLKTAVEGFEEDTSSYACVLYGERGNFSYGLDPNDSRDNLEEFQMLLRKITESYSKKPLVAAISGFAAGPGFDLALWCDFRVVEETAVLSAYARTLGVPINETTAKQLSTLVGTYRALDWLLTGRIVKAKEALDCGIATRVVACGAGLGQAVNFATSLSNMPQACLRADRAMLLSMCEKFTPVIRNIINEEKEKNIKIALTEVKKGIHITKSGDVRKKDS